MTTIVKPKNKTVIDRISQRLEEVGFTDEYLVKAIPIEHDKLDHYLSGKKPIPSDLLYRIADTLSVDVKWLRGEQLIKY